MRDDWQPADTADKVTIGIVIIGVMLIVAIVFSV